jgi:hypothetical protein
MNELMVKREKMDEFFNGWKEKLQLFGCALSRKNIIDHSWTSLVDRSLAMPCIFPSYQPTNQLHYITGVALLELTVQFQYCNGKTNRHGKFVDTAPLWRGARTSGNIRQMENSFSIRQTVP